LKFLIILRTWICCLLCWDINSTWLLLVAVKDFVYCSWSWTFYKLMSCMLVVCNGWRIFCSVERLHFFL